MKCHDLILITRQPKLKNYHYYTKYGTHNTKCQNLIVTHKKCDIYWDWHLWLMPYGCGLLSRTKQNNSLEQIIKRLLWNKLSRDLVH